MTDGKKIGIDGKKIGRRAALIGMVGALPGCSVWDEWFGETKPPLPGRREAVMAARRGMRLDDGAPKVSLPAPVRNANWPQTGGNPSHMMGHLSAGERLERQWTSSIGAGGGYRRKILSQPMISGDRVYTMDSDAVVTCFELRNGGREWRFDTKDEDADSTNVGGGIAVDGDSLYAVNGIGDFVVLDTRSGKQKYRKRFGIPARSSPTVADGRVFFTTIEDKLICMAADDGRQLWTHQARSTSTAMLGQPAPAYADGLVVAGFGSGELACLRAESGSVSWTDSLAAVRGRTSIADISAIRGLPVIAGGRVFVMGVGGLTVAIDLRVGRRLWEREVGGTETPWVAGDWVFILSSEQQVAAVSAADGRITWVTDLPRWEDEEKSKGAIYWTGPVLAGDRLIVGCRGGEQEAFAISPYTGKIIGRQPLPGNAALAPVVADNKVFTLTDDATLMALG
jgi:outer membrane protein assembly factor BamB